MKILITGAGGASAISIWKSLRQEEVFMADADPCAAGLYLVPKSRRFIIPNAEHPSFIPTLLSLCKSLNIQILMVTVDAELIPCSEAVAEFTRLQVALPLSGVDVLKLCRDKYALLHHCSSTILTANARLLNNQLIIHDEEFPLFAKPRFGAGSRGVLLVKNRQSLLALPQDSSYLLQTYLPGEEYSIDVLMSKKGEPIAAVPRVRMKIDSGIAVAARTIQDASLCALAVQVAAVVGIKFVANIQFKLDKQGQYNLLEINPRFPGTLPLTIQAGVDMPKLLLDDLHNTLLLKPGLLPYQEVMVVRYLTEKYLPISEWAALCP